MNLTERFTGDPWRVQVRIVPGILQDATKMFFVSGRKKKDSVTSSRLELDCMASVWVSEQIHDIVVNMLHTDLWLHLACPLRMSPVSDHPGQIKNTHTQIKMRGQAYRSSYITIYLPESLMCKCVNRPLRQ